MHITKGTVEGEQSGVYYKVVNCTKYYNQGRDRGVRWVRPHSPTDHKGLPNRGVTVKKTLRMQEMGT